MADQKPQTQHQEHISDPPPPPQKTTWYMVVFSVSVGLFGWLANFDAAFGGIVLLMDPYKKAFGSCVVTTAADGSLSETCSLTALKQSLIQITILFMSVGGILGGFTGDAIGRRGTLQVASLFIAVGAGGMMATAGSFLQYMVCKCIGGVGIGMIYSAAPTWGTESVASQKRGLLMSFYNVGLASGNVIAAAASFSSPILYKPTDPSAPGLHRILDPPLQLVLANPHILPNPRRPHPRLRQRLLPRIPPLAAHQEPRGRRPPVVCKVQPARPLLGRGRLAGRAGAAAH